MKALISGALCGWLGIVSLGAMQSPLLTIATPAPGTVSGIVSLLAQASAAGLTTLRFAVNGQPVGTEILAGPCSFSWDSRGVADGTHTITASGLTTTGTTVTTAARVVTVANIVTPPPPPPPPQSQTPPAGSVQVAVEGQTATFAGTQMVWYGANANFIAKPFTDSVLCTYITFGGDPIYGVPKACWLALTTTPPPTPVACVVSAWGAWSAWTPINATTEQRTRTRTVTTPASNGGTACPVLTESETRPIVVVPTVVFPTPIYKNTQALMTWTIPASPDGTIGWTLRLRRNGANVGSTTSATVTCGQSGYTWRWSKSGQTNRDSAAFTVGCS